VSFCGDTENMCAINALSGIFAAAPGGRAAVL